MTAPAEAVRCRIDFKYAMAMALDDPGFHHSVLAAFRDRLAEGDRADRLLDLVLARLTEAGLVREHTTQRTDSTHVLAAVRDLTRLELVTEAVRASRLHPAPAPHPPRITARSVTTECETGPLLTLHRSKATAAVTCGLSWEASSPGVYA
ncbi:transposase [Streptomyces sp. NPDC057438]|uniref:transposase n=1 Tax=Streptomyces sp. NPDC057438 TaxID=3346133 RepID=UPI0036CD9514